MCTEAEQPVNMLYLNLINILQSAESLKCGGGETTTIGCLSEFDDNRSIVLGKKAWQNIHRRHHLHFSCLCWRHISLHLSSDVWKLSLLLPASHWVFWFFFLSHYFWLYFLLEVTFTFTVNICCQLQIPLVNLHISFFQHLFCNTPHLIGINLNI